MTKGTVPFVTYSPLATMSLQGKLSGSMGETNGTMPSVPGACRKVAGADETLSDCD